MMPGQPGPWKTPPGVRWAYAEVKGGNAMDVVGSALRTVRKAAEVTTSAAGAVGGAAVNGVIGAAQGAVSGAREGVEKGSDSTPAALLTLGAIGATGLIEWPIVLAVGGSALLIRQLSRSSGTDREAASDAAAGEPNLKVVDDTTGSGATSRGATRKATKPGSRKTSRSRATSKSAR